MHTLSALFFGVVGTAIMSFSTYGVAVAFAGNHSNPAGLFNASLGLMLFGVGLLVLAYFNYREIKG